MDALTSIVTALAAGAAAGLNATVAQAVKDGYAALKARIRRRYAGVNVDLLDQDPASEERRTAVKGELLKTDAASDVELLRAAKALLDAIHSQAVDGGGAIGVDVTEIKAASLTIEDVIAAGTGVKIERAEVAGDVTIKQVRAGGQRGTVPNP